MLQKLGVTQNLAQFVISTRWEDIPEQIRHQAKRSLLNFFAVTIAGCRTDPVDLALKSLSEFTGGRQATVIGRSERLDALSAAFLNGAGANVHDYCDTHARTALHGTAPLAPGLLALSELRTVSGADLLLAFVLGFEVQCRIGNAISPGHYVQGWHITSSCGIFGAAAGAGKLLGLDLQKMIWTLGIASTQSSGLCECLGWPAKSVGVGNSARNGLWAALLAERGYQGPAEPIAGAQGFFHAMGQEPNWSALTEGLGETWELAENSFKPYPGGFVIHPFLDAVLDWKRDHSSQAIDRIVLHAHPLVILRTDRPNVSTARESQSSVQHSVAAALVFGKAGVEQFSEAAVHDPAVLDVRRRIEVVRDENTPVISARIELWTKDGAKHDLSVPAARGSAPNPMSDHDLEEKLRNSVAGWEQGHDIQPLIDAIWALDKSPDVSKLAALATPRA
jgi:2-methylcitrate dehydratase PrpD